MCCGEGVRVVQLAPYVPSKYGKAAHELASQPFDATRSQSKKPVAHAKPHAPEPQKLTAFARAGHAMPHPPQLEGSSSVSVHMPRAARDDAGPRGAHLARVARHRASPAVGSIGERSPG